MLDCGEISLISQGTCPLPALRLRSVRAAIGCQPARPVRTGTILAAFTNTILIYFTVYLLFNNYLWLIKTLFDFAFYCCLPARSIRRSMRRSIRRAFGMRLKRGALDTVALKAQMLHTDIVRVTRKL